MRRVYIFMLLAVISIIPFADVSYIYRRCKIIESYEVVRKKNGWELKFYQNPGKEVIECYGLQKIVSGLKSINLSVNAQGIEVYFRGEGNFCSPYDVSGYHALIGIKITSVDSEFYLNNYSELVLKIREGSVKSFPQECHYFVCLFSPPKGGYYFISPEKGGIVPIEVKAEDKDIVIPISQLFPDGKVPHSVILIIGVKQESGIYSGSFILHYPIRFSK